MIEQANNGFAAGAEGEPNLIPSYADFHAATAAKMNRKFPKAGRILLIGSGSGRELEGYAAANPNWTFVIQDLNQEDIERRKARAKEAGLGDRVAFNNAGAVDENLSGMRFEAIVCLFVTHFIKGLGDKERFLGMLLSLLKPHGSLYLADLLLPDEDDTFQYNDMAEFAILRGGLPRDYYYPFIDNLKRSFDSLSYRDYKSMIQKCGFGVGSSYFKALGFQAFECVNPAAGSDI